MFFTSTCRSASINNNGLRKQHFLALDVLRGVAALAVTIGHTQHVLGVPLFFGNTALAVDFFFMLSGFVVAHAYQQKLESGTFSGTYVKIRIIRLYPLIILGTLVGALSHLITASASEIPSLLKLLMKGLLLIPELMPTHYDQSFLPLNPPAWSLFFEVVVSLLFLLRIFRGKLHKLLVIISALAIALVTYRTGGLNTGWSAATLPYGFARIMYGFSMGVLLFQVQRSTVIGWVRCPVSMLSLLLLAVLIAPAAPWWYQLLCVFVVFPFVILAALDGGEAELGRSKPSPLKVWLGDLSYPLYALHWPIFRWVRGCLKALGIPPSSWWGCGIAVIVAVAMSTIAAKAFDEPVRRVLRKRFIKDDL